LAFISIHLPRSKPFLQIKNKEDNERSRTQKIKRITQPQYAETTLALPASYVSALLTIVCRPICLDIPLLVGVVLSFCLENIWKL
jgi:hypothetical protein